MSGWTARLRCGLALMALAACQGEGREPKAEQGKAPSGSAGSPQSAGSGEGGDSGEGGEGGDRKNGGAAAEPSAPAKAQTSAQIIARLGALPAWEGVVQRGQYLDRRGQRGALYGRIGEKLPGESGNHVWLLDDTEGEGSLAVRAAFADGAPPPGSRVVLSGAWTLEAPPAPSSPSLSSPAPTSPPPSSPAPSLPAPSAPAAPPVGAPAAAPVGPPTWVWKVESVTPLPDDGAAWSPTSPIGHDIKLGPRPAAAVPISKAKDNDLAVFQVLAAPRRLGEAWLVGDQLGSPPIAMLSLPGDRASYGGIDFRQPDEQWRLRRGATYVVRIGKIRRKDPSKPATINARNAPTKL